MIVTFEYRTTEGAAGIMTVPESDPKMILHWLSGFCVGVNISNMKVMG